MVATRSARFSRCVLRCQGSRSPSTALMLRAACSIPPIQTPNPSKNGPSSSRYPTVNHFRPKPIGGETLTHYADEESFHAMRLPEEGDDFEYRQMVNAETAKLMIAHGLQLEAQVLDAKQYFEWLGTRQNTYQAQHEYPDGRHVSGDEAKALLGIK